MKNQSIIYGFMIIAVSLLVLSCNNEASKSEANEASENNTTEMAPNKPADTTMKINELAEPITGTRAGEKDEKEESEKNKKK